MRTAVVEPPVPETLIDRDTFERAWHGVPGAATRSPVPATSATLTITRDTAGDFQDRQVYVWVDDESWGKIKYGRPLSREIPPGTHCIRVNNTLFNDRLTFTARPGEHVRVRCHNGMPRVGWLMFLFLHATYLLVKLEREA
ncbi:MAG: hypothetical protein AB7H93_10800 [Vicinamibacterales bacterium]